MSTWQSLLLAFGGNAALLAVLGLLGKSLLEKLIVRDTKRFESELKSKTDVAIEHLRTDLQLKTIEHQVRFSRLHEKRAEVIAKLYRLMVVALWEAESFLSPMEWAGEPNKNEKHLAATNQLVKLFRYFDQHRIYLPDELCVSLDTLINQVRSQVIAFGVWVRYDDKSLSPDSAEKKHAAWMKGWDAIKQQVPEARRSLEKEFRSLLGAAANITSGS